MDGLKQAILDALVSAGALPDDSQDEITAISHEFAVDKADPHIEVTLDAVMR